VHAVVVTVTVKDPEPAVAALHEQVVPRVSQAPGFVTGYWLRSEGNQGLSVLVCESEEAAQALAEQVRSAGAPSDAVDLDGVEVREVVANA
jgi:heme-degrading monooxygenase HmoA